MVDAKEKAVTVERETKVRDWDASFNLWSGHGCP